MRGETMTYRKMTAGDAAFLTRIFSVPEYELYFAENGTSEADWKERIALYENKRSLIVSHGDKEVGWLMYEVRERVCFVDILVLLPGERRRGYGRAIMRDLAAVNPGAKAVRLDVQQRNGAAVSFYKRLGFRIESEEEQPVNGEPVLYYTMVLPL